MTHFRTLLLILSVGLLIACGSDKEKKEESDSIKIGSSKEKDEKDDSKITIELTGNDLMQYNLKEIKVKSGQEVTVNLRHIGTMDLLVMGHNFVLLKQGVNLQEFALAATEAGQEADWIPDGGKDVIVHTKMLGGGESVSITFMAPEVGTYDFLCSFTGHSALMKGKFIVE